MPEGTPAVRASGASDWTQHSGGFGLILCLAMIWALLGPANASAAPKRYVVILKNGASQSQDARSLGATPTMTYGAPIPGYAAVLSDSAQQQVKSDPNVLMAVADRHFKGAGTKPRQISSAGVRGVAEGGTDRIAEAEAEGCATAANGYCLATGLTQAVPSNLERVGLLESPTADINGTDDPIPVGVAVLDTGIETENPELNVAGGVNCSDSPQPGYGDVYGHGTFVGGVIAAEDNSFGVVGVAPGAPLYSVRVLDENDGAELSNILCGIDWVIAHRSEIRVANMSFVEEEVPVAEDHHCGRTVNDPLHLAICEGVKDGITFVAAAGNYAENTAEAIPAGYSQVITAGGLSDTDGKPGGEGGECWGYKDDVFAPFSNYGRAVDVLAVATCDESDFLEGTVVEWEGTSFASPAVAGAAALLLDQNPTLTPREVRHTIKTTAERDRHLPGRPPTTTRRILNVGGF